MAILTADLDEARLRELCAQECSESQTLDFKRELPGNSDRGKSEFLKDVCAIANSDGGELVYGINEADGKAKSLAPISTEPADATKRRLGQIIDAGIEPRIMGLQLREVRVGGGYVLIVTVPASFNGPHRYSVNSPGRFVMRNGTHTTELTYGQLRAAFDRTATLAERARRFRDERLSVIANRQTWRPVLKGPVCVFHLIPIAAMAGNRSIDIKDLYSNYTRFMFQDWGGASRSTNLDGLIVHRGGDEKDITAYVQVFRSGALEAVRFGGGLVDPTRKLIPSRTVSVFYRTAIDKFLVAIRSLGISGPAIVGAALLTVSGYIFGLPPEQFNQRTTDRSDLVLPEIWLDDIDSATDIDDVARPLLDVLWQAFDVDRCHEYTPEGKWRTDRW